MALNRAEQRDEFLYALGKFVAPLEALVESDNDVSKDIPFVRAQHQKNWGPLTEIAYNYCKVDGIEFGQEYSIFIATLSEINATFDLLRKESKDYCRRFLDEILTRVKNAIRAIPCDFDPAMLTAGSPFQAYMRLRTIFAAADKKLEVFDPWLGTDVFYRYLSEVKPRVKIVVVTATKRLSGAEGQKVTSVSELFAMERPSDYRLIEAPSLHDRHIRCDDTVFHVGGSLKDAAKKDAYSITPVPSQGTIATELDQLIATGIEWFGPSTTPHRR